MYPATYRRDSTRCCSRFLIVHQAEYRDRGYEGREYLTASMPTERTLDMFDPYAQRITK